MDGFWEFYPGQLVDPESIDEAFEKYEKIYVKVPGDWVTYLNNDKSVETGTYRLKIKVPKDGMYGIKTSTIRTSCRIFMNGKEVAGVGSPSLDKNEYSPGSRYEIGFADSVNEIIEVVIHVSSYGYRAGGILKSIRFGSFEAIVKENNLNFAHQ